MPAARSREHKKAVRARIQREYVARLQRRLAAYKQERGCACCGLSGPDYLLEFHHLDPAQKKFTISREVARRGIAELLEEAEKCAVLCANCHRMVERGDLQLGAIPKLEWMTP